jgi:hypothetical protein
VPFTGTAAPFRTPLVAFFEVQVRVAEFPETIDVALAVIPAATGPAAPTVTVVALVAVAPDADCATTV